MMSQFDLAVIGAGPAGLSAAVTAAEHGVDTVIHFAGHIVVPESVQDPLKYYRNNTCATRNLLQCCAEAGVRHFIFSSTAAVYGAPETMPVTEQAPTVPVSPGPR